MKPYKLSSYPLHSFAGNGRYGFRQQLLRSMRCCKQAHVIQKRLWRKSDCFSVLIFQRVVQVDINYRTQDPWKQKHKSSCLREGLHRVKMKVNQSSVWLELMGGKQKALEKAVLWYRGVIQTAFLLLLHCLHQRTGVLSYLGILPRWRYSCLKFSNPLVDLEQGKALQS